MIAHGYFHNLLQKYHSTFYSTQSAAYTESYRQPYAPQQVNSFKPSSIWVYRYLEIWSKWGCPNTSNTGLRHCPVMKPTNYEVFTSIQVRSNNYITAMAMHICNSQGIRHSALDICLLVTAMLSASAWWCVYKFSTYSYDTQTTHILVRLTI